MAGDITGMICDGAKGRLLAQALPPLPPQSKAALFAKNGVVLPDDNGILATTVEQTMQNMGSQLFGYGNTHR